MKAMIHVQHLVGSGPAVRAAALAGALDESGAETALVTGNRLPPFVRYGGYEIVDLPAARAKNASGQTVIDERGVAVDDAWRNRRRTRLLEHFADFAPDIIVTETWPFGSRFPDFELDALLAAARQRERAPRIVCAANDLVLRREDPAAEAETTRRLLEHFDMVLVNGDPDLVPLERSFAGTEAIAHLLRYTGYLHAGAEAIEPRGEDGVDEVIVSCGGGAVGDLLLTQAVRARVQGAASGLRWRVLVGNDMDDLILSRLASEAPDGVIVERARHDFPNLLRRARLSVSQGGYNTFVDLLAAGCPAVLVPFARGGETAQTQRAEALAGRGAAVVLPELDLTPDRLAEAIERALALPRAGLAARLDGLPESVRQLHGLAAAVAA